MITSPRSKLNASVQLRDLKRDRRTRTKPKHERFSSLNHCGINDLKSIEKKLAQPKVTIDPVQLNPSDVRRNKGE